jgi:pyruvate,water dikinase
MIKKKASKKPKTKKALISKAVEKDNFILWFEEISIKDVAKVGGKNASLGEMYRELTKKGIRIPNGFATTAQAYQYFLEKTGLKNEIKRILKGLNVKDMKNLAERGRRVREAILRAELPKDLKEAIVEAYHQLGKEKNIDVAVRSSGTAEDLPSASFAGQMETYLNVQGEAEVLEAVKKCMASLFTNRAIAYREEKGFSHFKIALSVGIQKMIRSDKACSGVMFSCDTESGFPDVVLINAAYGLGENIVQGKVNPDEYLVFETTLRQGFKPIISKSIGSKELRMIYSLEGGEKTKNVPVPKEEQRKFALKDREILQLARWSCLVEDHYGRPMDIEWAKDGLDGKLYLLQARPETVQSQRDVNVITNYELRITNKEKLKILLTGIAVGSKIAQGKVNVIKDVHEIGKFKKGEILVTEMTDPDWVPIMKIASAIVTNAGGRTCHAAIVSREMGIPCIVGTGNATQVLKTGQEVTVCCAEGEEGKVYQGLVPYKIKKINIKNLPRPKTKIMMNIGEPDQAFALSFIPNDGVGLAREEFIINDYIKIHPLALLEATKLRSNKATKLDKETIQKIEELTYGYKDKKQFFVDKLAEGIGKIAAAFYPKEVIVRFSDFKTNEYANLIGGKAFEPEEANPMIGWRGASRYYSEEFREAFALECQAIKKVREVFGLTNVIVMIPFCRTVEEGRKVLEEMRKNELRITNYELRGNRKKAEKLPVYVMCEIPSNVLLAEEFAKIFDGFSIGSNDLTQLTLGIDRDSALVSHIYDERNQAVKKLIKEVIEKAHLKGKKVGICGQAPSDFPDFARFLVKSGIDSISLNPDTIIKTTLEILKEEKKLKIRGPTSVRRSDL